jgi:glycosyltransferase 2 family protein
MNWLKENLTRITRLLFVGSLLFALIYFYKIFSVETFNLKDVIHIVYVVPVIWVWLTINGNNYYLMLTNLGVPISRKQAISIWLKSNLSIYTPGKIGLLLTRLGYHKELNHDLDKIGFVILNESLLTILSSILVVFISSFLVIQTKFSISYYAYVLIAGLIIVLLNPYSIKKVQLMYSKIRKVPLKSYHLSYSCMFYVISFNFLKWILWGFASWWILNEMISISFFEIPYLLFTYCSASLIGVLAFFTPSGIGVMEVYTTELYSLIIPSTVAASFSILIRIWKVIGEISILALFKLLDKKII